MVALKIALAAVAVLLVFALVVRLIQSSLAFFPTPGETGTPADFGVDYRSVLVSTADGERLQGWELTHRAPAAQVLYFHGNGGNLSMWTSVFADIARRGYAVFAFDYRGYGVSTGRPSEQGLYPRCDGGRRPILGSQTPRRTRCVLGPFPGDRHGCVRVNAPRAGWIDSRVRLSRYAVAPSRVAVGVVDEILELSLSHRRVPPRRRRFSARSARRRGSGGANGAGAPAVRQHRGTEAVCPDPRRQSQRRDAERSRRLLARR